MPPRRIRALPMMMMRHYATRRERRRRRDDDITRRMHDAAIEPPASTLRHADYDDDAADAARFSMLPPAERQRC